MLGFSGRVESAGVLLTVTSTILRLFLVPLTLPTARLDLIRLATIIGRPGACFTTRVVLNSIVLAWAASRT